MRVEFSDLDDFLVELAQSELVEKVVRIETALDKVNEGHFKTYLIAGFYDAYNLYELSETLEEHFVGANTPIDPLEDAKPVIEKIEAKCKELGLRMAPGRWHL